MKYFEPSGFKHAAGEKLVLRQLARGVYVVENTYGTTYDYFGRLTSALNSALKDHAELEESTVLTSVHRR